MAGHTPWRELDHKATPEQAEAARNEIMAELAQLNVEHQLIQEAHRLIDESDKFLRLAEAVPPWRFFKWHRLIRESKKRTDAATKVCNSIDRMQSERRRTI